MVEPELVPVGVEPLLAEKQACPGMMQARVVQYDESWIGDEIRPHVVVERRVAELIDDEIVRCAAMLPDEIVRPRFREALDGELVLQQRHELGGVRCHAGTGRRQRREPREPQGGHWSLVIGPWVVGHWSLVISW